ncbi:MAG: alpha-hydroxy-acid oxidizing protein [Chloroflexi bacterium]|nr:alpha-hydroxy-acid oxidizing protein [Chloroflexota bacterium]
MRTFVNIEDLRRAAKWNMPKPMFEYVDGGANDEWTLRENRAGFERITFDPKVLVDVSERDMSTTVFGEKLKTPIIIAPTGMTGIAWPNAELLAARAAGRIGAGLALSTYATCAIEDVARTGPGPFWFQLYISKDRAVTDSLVVRAQAAGYKALAITVDTQVPSMRERDVRNGYQAPPRITAGNVADIAWRIGWLKRFLVGPRPAFRNFSGDVAFTPRQFVEMGASLSRQMDASVTWKDIDHFRALWKGPLLLKGVVSTRDVKTALEHGVDGFIVSNHGGRQLDYAPSSIEVLPEIVDACAGRAEVYLDSGVRRGSDIVKAVALGARAVLVGRPYVWALGAAGEEGADTMFRIFRDEVDRCLALIGVPKLSEVTREDLRAYPQLTAREKQAIPVAVRS